MSSISLGHMCGMKWRGRTADKVELWERNGVNNFLWQHTWRPRSALSLCFLTLCLSLVRLPATSLLHCPAMILSGHCLVLPCPPFPFRRNWWRNRTAPWISVSHHSGLTLIISSGKRAEQDKTRQDQDKTRQDKTRQRQDKTRQDKIRSCLCPINQDCDKRQVQGQRQKKQG